MKVYLDNCCFNRPYDSQRSERIKLETEAKLHIQTLIVKRQLQLVWSFMMEYENSANPYPSQREAIAEWKEISAQYIPALENIREQGLTIEKATGIKSKDALHLACAIEAACDTFITTDRSFLKKAQKIKEIKTLNPVDFVMVLED